MRLSENMLEALNAQINAELFSAYLYFAMSAYLQDQKLPGMAAWMFQQGLEELGHAKKFYDYVNERNGRVVLKAVEEPPKEWKDARDVFEEGLKHEVYITKRINDLVALAKEENDYATLNFLQWFVDEQVEEEASFEAVLDKFSLLEKHPGGTYLLDRELSHRVGAQ